MRLILASVSLFISCAPCAQSEVKVFSVCTRADAGAIVPDAPFTLLAESYATNSSCTVAVDGGAIALELQGAGCSAPGASAGKPAPSFVPCAMPALPAGTYSIATAATTPTTMTLGDGGVFGIPDCSR
ncbi:MAG: hypothetical protein ACOZQL_22235 [Myxococcota bacterium]